MKKLDFGIMQGRLLPKFKNRYQAHPLGYWQQEFVIAKQIGISYIEFILDYEEHHLNPLMTNSGIEEINCIIQKTGVGVKSICADFFMDAPIHSIDESVSNKSVEVLLRLIVNASELGIKDIVIPCVDHSSLKDLSDQRRLIANLFKPIELASELEVNLALETDLSPTSFLNLLEQFDSEVIKVNYDVGNSAALGFNMVEEFELYGNRISDLHIKDRELGGGSVELGSGNVDFNLFLKLFSKLDFNGPIVMQVYRDDEGIEIFKKQFDWFKKQIENEFNSGYSS
jgi:L-ribulose-5-phosphate 3-epimerase